MFTKNLKTDIRKLRREQLTIFPKNRNDVSWKVPSLFYQDHVVLMLSDLCNELNINLPISSVYGCVKSTWGGGRPSMMQDIDRNLAEEIISKYNARNISCCFTFSNYNVTRDHLEDRIGNLLLDVASQTGVQNYAIVSSDILTEYIRDKYPNIKLISSILKPIYELDAYDFAPEYYNKLCEIYDRVVVRSELCFYNKFLKKLKYKNKIEIIVNQDCLIYCPLSRKHYDFHSLVELGLKDRKEGFCSRAKLIPETVFNTSLLSNQDLDRIIPLGFKSFKLRGRTYTEYQLLELIGNYVFDPTGVYQNIKNLLIQRFNDNRANLIVN